MGNKFGGLVSDLYFWNPCNPVSFDGTVLRIGNDDDHMTYPVRSDELQTVVDHIFAAEVATIISKKINLGSCCKSLFNFIAQCKDLQHLGIYFTSEESPINANLIDGLEAALPMLNKLICVAFASTHLGPEAKRVFSSLCCPQLRLLILSHVHVTGCGHPLASALERVPLLKSLVLTDTGLAAEEMLCVLESLRSHCPLVTILALEHNDLCECSEELAALAKALLQLKVLAIQNCNLKTLPLLNIIQRTNESIEYLDILGNGDTLKMESEIEISNIIEQRKRLKYMVLKKSQVSTEAWNWIEYILKGRGGHLHEHVLGSEEDKKDLKYLCKMREDCMEEYVNTLSRSVMMEGLDKFSI